MGLAVEAKAGAGVGLAPQGSRAVALLRKQKRWGGLPPSAGAEPHFLLGLQMVTLSRGGCYVDIHGGQSAVLCMCIYGLSRSLRFQVLQFRADQLIPDLWARGGPGRSPCASSAGVRNAPGASTVLLMVCYHHFALKCVSFCQQLEQSQKEASDLLEQNRLLQDQLRVALGREQSAREGYVLQVGLRGGGRSRCSWELECKGPGS